jgi:hypothetical protein
MKEFYLTLPSNASHHLHPKNTLNSYKTKIERTINLEGEWSAGLSEIQFVNDFDNISDNNAFVIKHYNRKQLNLVERKLQPGKYKKVTDVIIAFRDAMLQACTLSMDFSQYVAEADRALHLNYDRLTGYV